MGATEQQVELPPQPTSAAVARRFVAHALHTLDPRAREVGVLLASELVTNAVLYTQSPITVRVTHVGHHFRVAVQDGEAHEVAPRHVGLEATSGRGLALVDELSAAWGVRLDDHGKEVWFELPEARAT